MEAISRPGARLRAGERVARGDPRAIQGFALPRRPTKYSVRGRDLGSAVTEAIRKVNHDVQLPQGYHIDWAGEYETSTVC
jgi:hypothetical protein